MLTSSDLDALNTFARDLAQRSFGGEASVGRRGNGLVQLIILKHGRAGGSLYRERDVDALTFEGASREIVLAIQSAAGP